MLISCPECHREISDQAASCPHCGFVQPAAARGEAPGKAGAAAKPKGRTPILLVLSVIGFVLCLFTPKFLLVIPLLVTAGCAAVAFMRRESGRLLAVLILAGCVGLLVLSEGGFGGSGGSGGGLGSGGGSSAHLEAAQIADWNWSKDRDFGTHGTIKWNVQVKNVSEKPISMARVEFTTYDKAGKLLASTFTYVQAIPPGETRSANSYADLYGTEAKAQTKLSSVDFAS